MSHASEFKLEKYCSFHIFTLLAEYLVINAKLLHQVQVQKHANGGLSSQVFGQTEIREIEVQNI